MKKEISSNKEVETFLFCDEVKTKLKESKSSEEELWDKRYISQMTKDLKQFNLEDNEDISHINQTINQYKDIYRDDEDRFVN